MKITVTEEHLNRALAVPWDTKTCIVSQAVSEAFGEPVVVCGLTGVLTKTHIGNLKNARQIQALFDDGHRRKQKTESIDTLRAMLPVEIEFNETTND